jgi:phosphoribosylformylglycinamidine (FGAM) synthase-like amidotransferase family enzyme
MHFGVVRFPGSNCDEDALHVVQRVLAPKGATGRLLWHKDTERLSGNRTFIREGLRSYAWQG